MLLLSSTARRTGPEANEIGTRGTFYNLPDRPLRIPYAGRLHNSHSTNTCHVHHMAWGSLRAVENWAPLLRVAAKILGMASASDPAPAAAVCLEAR